MTTEEKIKALTQKFELEIANLSNQIAKKADEIEGDSDIISDRGIGFTVTDKDGSKYNFEWKEVSFHLPIPRFSMLEQRISFDVPSITMKTNKIIFNVPAVKMVDKQIGIKPESKCGWKIGWVLGVKTKKWECKFWDSPIIISVPEPYSKEVKIIVDIPEIKMITQEIISKVPSVTVEMKYVKFNSIVLNSIDYQEAEGNIEEVENEINVGQKKIDLLTYSFQEELNTLTYQLTNESFDKAELDLKVLMKPHQEKFEQGIRELKESIKILKNNNATERVIIEEKELSNLISQMSIFMKPYEDALIELNKTRIKALEDLKTSAINA